jgi:hypothetical protein
MLSNKKDTKVGTGGYNDPRTLKRSIPSNQKLVQKTHTSRVTSKVIDQKKAS